MARSTRCRSPPPRPRSPSCSEDEQPTGVDRLLEWSRQQDLCRRKRALDTYPQTTLRSCRQWRSQNGGVGWLPDDVVDIPRPYEPVDLVSRFSHLDTTKRLWPGRPLTQHPPVSCLKSGRDASAPKPAKWLHFNLLAYTEVDQGAADIVLAEDLETREIYWPKARFVDGGGSRRDPTSRHLSPGFTGDWDALAARSPWAVNVYDEEPVKLRPLSESGKSGEWEDYLRLLRRRKEELAHCLRDDADD
ncbi:hypothetical protein QBC44DRAFT_307505 [Cladorrhinum sp. PSN332]|nr:hypothetical protein QBC44DRAFT_307505 [Cladorrhinum sp. PSN332]